MMLNKDLVSVAMTTYNGERYLNKQLDSIYSQTYKNIEVIVTDDVSSDGTLAILEGYKKHFGLKVYSNLQNIGFKQNFLNTISHCSGKYIALADQDDIWDPDKLMTLVQNISDKSLIFSDLRIIDEKDNIIFSSYAGLKGKTIPTGPMQRTCLYFTNYVTGCSCMFKSELIPEILRIPGNEDSHDWWIAKVAARRNGIGYIAKPLTYYRRHLKNTSDSYCGSLPTRILKRCSLRRADLWFKKYIKMKESLAYAINNDDSLPDEEKQVLEAGYLFLENLLNGKITLGSLKAGYKLRNSIYIPGYHFFLKTPILLAVAILGKSLGNR